MWCAVWGYGLLAVTIDVFACDIAVLLLPCIRHFPVLYDTVLKFMVALAVGALSATGILILIPEVSQSIIIISPHSPQSSFISIAHLQFHSLPPSSSSHTCIEKTPNIALFSLLTISPPPPQPTSPCTCYEFASFSDLVLFHIYMFRYIQSSCLIYAYYFWYSSYQQFQCWLTH